MVTGLIIVDVQLGMFESKLISPINGGEELLEKIKGLINKARKADVPIIYVQHCGGAGHPLEKGSPGWNIHPAIAPASKDIVVQKWTPDSFFNTNLEAELNAKNIKNILIAGLQTEYCIDTTCRRAFSLGYDVTLVRDAHSTWDNDILNSRQIIEHHNLVLGEWFVKLKETDEIDFVI